MLRFLRYLLLLCFALPLPALRAQSDLSYEVTEVSPGIYDIDISGLEPLSPMEPVSEFPAPYYELFIEVGDGYFVRKQRPNPASAEEVYTYRHYYGVREPRPTQIHVLGNPIYSPNHRPALPDALPVSPVMVHDPGNTNGITYDFVPANKLAQADLNWPYFVAEDDFIILAGYQQQASNSNLQIDLSDGGVISVYYDESLVYPVIADDGDPTHRSYEVLTVDEADIADDPVFDNFEGAVNQRIDFLLPPTKLDEGIVYLHFKLHDAATLGETESFPIGVAVRAIAADGPSESYDLSTVVGEIRGGKDPNEIIGMPRPICLEDSVPNELSYHIEFFNDGDAAVDSFVVEITFSEYVRLENVSDLQIDYLRIGDTYVPASEYLASPEVIPGDEPRMRWVLPKMGILYGFHDPQVGANPDLYRNCSAEIDLRVPFNAEKTTCDTIPARLDITFPSGVVTTRRDSLPCQCEEAPIASSFPCSIVPSIPFLGGCWCTLLLLLLLLVIAYLVWVIIRNQNSGTA